MDTIWQLIKGTGIRYKLARYYTVCFILLLGIAFIAVYFVSENYRREEFHQRLVDRTITTYKIYVEVPQIDSTMQHLIDKNTMNSLYEEHILLFDFTGKLIYNTLPGTKPKYPANIINKLQNDRTELQMTDGKYDVVGVKFNFRDSIYYGIAEAYDNFGKKKLDYLKIVLIVTFLVITFLIIILSFYLSKIITRPITQLTKQVEAISPNNLKERVSVQRSDDEVSILAKRFNELMDKVENAFSFQKNSVHHLSHELKTPLAVMMANAERALAENDDDAMKASLQFQKESLMELSGIINSMLDISKTEEQLTATLIDTIRLDELLFECMEEMTYIDSAIRFDFNMDKTIEGADKLTINGNNPLLKIVILNLLKNAIKFSTNMTATVEIASSLNTISINFLNNGDIVPKEERSKLFTHFFRGRNSKDKKGFGLGLVLASKIAVLHKGYITYTVLDEKNCFILQLPLAT